MGVSGNTVRILAARWDTDVVALEPEWLAVMIGINDVWRQFDGVDSNSAVPLEEYGRRTTASSSVPGRRSKGWFS